MKKSKGNLEKAYWTSNSVIVESLCFEKQSFAKCGMRAVGYLSNKNCRKFVED